MIRDLTLSDPGCLRTLMLHFNYITKKLKFNIAHLIVKLIFTNIKCNKKYLKYS